MSIHLQDSCLFWCAATDIVVPLLRRFLLKYASRDEIELMGRGNGGIVEIRNAIGQYEEPSPLFGFLRYRRRNVVIKYVPDGCSRLVQGGLPCRSRPKFSSWEKTNRLIT
jgi:hypothetical protein